MDRNLSGRIATARKRLGQKFSGIDLGKLGISDYNRKYLSEYSRNSEATLKIYGELLLLSLQGSSVSPEKFVFVDYGGGSGLLSLLAKEAGIGTVIYTDIYDVSCADVRILSGSVGLNLDHVVCGDLSELHSYLKMKSLRINVVASNDVIEHIYDVAGHFSGLRNISSGPFRIVYASSANMENPWYLHAVTKQQLEAEFKNRDKTEGYKERDTLTAYIQVRRDIISSFAPALSIQQIELLAASTRGLIRADIEKCVEEYLRTGRLGYCADTLMNTCDPYTGNWCEHLMSGEWLQQVLSRAGFSSYEVLAGYWPVTGPLHKKIIKFLLNGMIRHWGRRCMFVSPYYVVLGEKADGAERPSLHMD